VGSEAEVNFAVYDSAVDSPTKTRATGLAKGDIKGKLRFQACNDESCFPPITREVKMWLNVE